MWKIQDEEPLLLKSLFFEKKSPVTAVSTESTIAVGFDTGSISYLDMEKVLIRDK